MNVEIMGAGLEATITETQLLIVLAIDFCCVTVSGKVTIRSQCAKVKSTQTHIIKGIFALPQ